MSVKLRASSGSYNVRASEMARDRPGVNKSVRCVVHFLDETETAFDIDKRAKAQTLLDKVFEHLELIEKDYFGLQFVDVAPAPDGVQSYQNNESNPVITTDVMRWLDPIKTLKKQMGMRPPYYLYFRVKFYVSDPSKLHEEYTRYHFFLQLKKDIVEGKLIVPYNTAVVLASYAVQSELGDYSIDDHTPGYLSELRFIPKQTPKFEEEVTLLHKQHRGLTPSDCELLFLEKVKDLEQYGVDIHNAFWVDEKDQSNLEIQLGVTSIGLVVFQNDVRINTFSWAKIVKISFKRKQFFIQLRREGVSGPLTSSTTSDNLDNLIGFNMVSYRSCKNLWKSCVEHHTFFRLHAPPQTKSGFLSIGSKFRYSGRTEFQTLEESKKRAKMERTFARSPSKRYARRTIGATSQDALLEERRGLGLPTQSQSLDSFRPHQDGYISLNSSPTKSLTQTTIPNSTSYPNSLRTPYTNNNIDNNNGFQHNHIRKTLPTDYKPNEYPSLKRNGSRTRNTPNHTDSPSTRTTPNHTNTRNTMNNTPSKPQNTGSLMEPDRTPRSLGGNNKTDYRLSRTVDNRTEQRASRHYENPTRPAPSSLKKDRTTVQNGSDMSGYHSNTGSLRSNASTIRSGAYYPHRNPIYNNSLNSSYYYNSDSLRSNASTVRGFNDKASVRSNASSHMTTSSIQKEAPVVPPKMIGYTDDEKSLTDQSYELPTYSDHLPNGSAYIDNHGLVTIRMKPDSQGRFGFNVKGGADQSMPIIVSRVAPNTPADLVIPRLNEGDQVLYINGRDVSQHTHEQVVMFIKASRETHSGELVLVVRPNAVYIGEDTPDEPDFQYIPDTHHITSTLPPGGSPLAGSMVLLQESLDSGAALAQFEQMYRKKPGMTMNAAKLTDNTPKNRYRDISPYDQTRVKLKHVSGDYINANFVNMEIKGSGVVNRYIAAQGPLPNTSDDFWQMVWDQQSTLIVMLTTNVERGRVKCHQYWPDLYETTDFSPLQVTCLKEEKSASFAFRDFTLVNVQAGKGEERHIRQMQYISWPDHGVPDDNADFLDFVLRVRQNRTGMVEPTVVHCSAGIGRTGVLITMETSMCLVEANQPVYPLDIVRQMRDQRAMLIQTSSQYKFVCEAILRVYNDKIVQPLDDYKR